MSQNPPVHIHLANAAQFVPLQNEAGLDGDAGMGVGLSKEYVVKPGTGWREYAPTGRREYARPGTGFGTGER